jgi:dynein heavy chain 1
MKLQGEYIVKLRELEDSLLDALNNVRGSILEDEAVIKTLEKLKKEAQEVMTEMRSADSIMNEVLAVTQTFVPLASSTSKIFFALQSLANVHYLYQFSLAFFMETVYYVLNKNENLNKIPKHDIERRRIVIFNEFFRDVYRRMNQALLFEDKIVFATKLVEVKLGEGELAK